MKYLRSVLWLWGILYLLVSGYRVLYCIAIVVCFLHHLYFKYSKQYIGVFISLVVMTVVRVELRPYWLILNESNVFQGTVIESKEYGAIVSIDGFKKVVVYDIEANLGDYVTVIGELGNIESLHNTGLFDYKRYMNQKGIYQSIQTDSYLVNKHSYIPSALIHRYVQSTDIAQLANQFLYGYSENTSLDLFFSTGMHFSFILYHIVKLCSFYLSEKHVKKIELLLSFGMLICFPNEFSLLRIFLFRLLTWTRWRGVSKLSIGMGILLFLHPECCTSLGFSVPFLLSLSNYYLKRVPRVLSSKLVLIPIQLATSFEVNLIWLLFFDVFKFLFSFDFFSMLIALCIPISPFTWLSNSFHNCIVVLYEYISHFNFYLIVGSSSLLCSILYMAGLFMLNESRKGLLLISASVLLFFIPLYCNPCIKVTFLDVGQGDSMVVEYPFHQGIVMVDTGGGMRDNLARQVLVPYIKSQGYSDLDVLIISHHDEDHDGAMNDLMEQVNVRNYIDYSNAPHKLRINSYEIQFLDIIRHGKDENNLSVISLFDFNGLFLLSAGDLSSENEEQLLREYPTLNVDFLKLSHHGSASSSSLYYLSRINPKIAFNSSGRNNVYRHPSYEVLDNLKQLGIPMYDTQEKGSIHLYIFNSISFILSAIDD